ncbi:MAG: TonB-dependent receptor [Acidobacteriia bacterium]|nr:TonB-dependent receptor [Terriglobia bacterium]
MQLPGGAFYFFVSALPALAQVCQPGELRVLVKDSQEAAIFNAQVSVEGQAAPRTTETNGIADFTGVACGSWTIRAAKTGFDPGTATVQMDSGAVVETTVVLNPEMNRSSVEVSDTAATLAQQSVSQANELHPAEVRTLPTNPATVVDTLPLVPGVVRSPRGELNIDGTGEERSSLVVNQSDVTDPATGRFGQSVPLNAIESVNVLNTPFLAQYGRFTQSVVAVETRRGGDKWHFDLNDPFPDFRVRKYRMAGIRNETPRAAIGGSIIPNRLYMLTALQYFLDKVPNRTLGFPYNVSKQERVNWFTQFDYVASVRQLLRFTWHFAPEHTNYVNPNFFDPQPTTPSYAQRNYVTTLAHQLGLWGGTLNSTVAMERFHTFIGSQGDADMVLTPEGNLGNYFGVQTRDAWRREWLEVWSPAPLGVGGTHLPKLGSSLTVANDRGHFAFRPVNIAESTGQLLETIDFLNAGSYSRTDLEATAYVQDHWAPSARLALDYGIRVEHQRLASSLRIAPRSGFSWTPVPGGRTVFRGGYGQFYDHIPLDVYAFSRYPIRTITMYGPDGLPIGGPIEYVDVIGSATGPRSFLVSGHRVAGAFSPRGYTWNAQVEHRFSRLVRARAVYTYNRSAGLITLEPELLGDTHEIVLNGDGSSLYRQLETTARVTWESGNQLNISYTRSRAEGSLNQFDAFLGNFALPVIRPDDYATLPGDLPNRFLLWGRVNPHIWSLQLLPIIEYRNGFPYTALNSLQQYVGTPNSDATRFPDFFSADTRVMRDFKVSKKYTVRLSVTGFNLTNHFNPVAVHNNVDDPLYGLFFGYYHRRYRFDFEVLF